jgi:hypothetical protein
LRSAAANLEEAFIAWLQDAQRPVEQIPPAPPVSAPAGTTAPRQAFSLRRLFSYSRREALELRRDPVRSTLALLGTVILMFIMGYGISMDVEDLRFAVLDRDQTSAVRAGRRISPVRATSLSNRRCRAMTNWTDGCATANWPSPLKFRLISAAILPAARR